jgi:hypothetical protein
MPSKPYPHPKERAKGRVSKDASPLCSPSSQFLSGLAAEPIVPPGRSDRDGFRGPRPILHGSACELNFNVYERFCCRFAAGAAEDWLLGQLSIVVSRCGFSGACSISRRGIGSGDNRSLISKEDLYSHVFPRARFLRQRGTGRCPQDVLGLAMGFRFDDNLRLASQTIKN